MMQTKFTIAVIGCGLTGTSLVCQLVRRFCRSGGIGKPKPESTRVIVFEKGPQMGPGMPHNAAFVRPYHVTNMCAEHMSVFHDRPGDFQIWVQGNRAELEKRFPDLCCARPGRPGPGQTCHHYPRALMGAYLVDRFNAYVNQGVDLGMQFDLQTHTEVVDLREDQKRVSIRALNLETGEAREHIVDRAVIATGHWVGTAREGGYFPSPWPADRLLQAIPEGSRVAIVGTSLSAIEAALTLTADGHFRGSGSRELCYQAPEKARRLAMFSRHGLLPTVRGKIGPYRNQILRPEKMRTLLHQKAGGLKLETLFDLFQAELQLAYGHPFKWQPYLDSALSPARRLSDFIAAARRGDGPDGDVVWQTVLHQVLPFVGDLYLALSIAERKRFEKRFKTPFFVFAAPQPIINARKVLALLNAGSLRIYRLAPAHAWTRHRQTRSYPVDYIDDRGATHRGCFPYVVDARGQELSWRKNPAALARNLLKTGTVQTTEIRRLHPPKDGDRTEGFREAYDAGSVWIDPRRQAVMRIDSSGRCNPSERVYAVGAMTRGQMIDVSMAQSLARSANRIAGDLLGG